MGYSIFDDTMVDMPWPEIEAAAGRGAIVLLPVGIIEEHGPHLGLGVDTYAAYLIAVKSRQNLAERGIEALITPPQYWGVSAATAIFGGTFHIRPETMQALMVDIIANLHRWGFKRVFSVNWHADLAHCRALLAGIRQAREETGLDAKYVATEFDRRRLRLTEDDEAFLLQKNGWEIDTGGGPYVDIHAGSLETAFMVRYFPDGIDTDYVKSLKQTELTFDDLRSVGKDEETTRKLIPDGYFGNPAGYDTGIAEATVEADAASYAGTVAAYLKEAR